MASPQNPVGTSTLRRGVITAVAMSVLSPAVCMCKAEPAPQGQGDAQELSPFAVVATVNGDPVTVGELRREMSGGSGAPETIRSRALRGVVEIKVQEALLRRKGIVADTSYRQSLRRLEQENQRRASALSKGEPVFGPKTFEEKQYFRYRFDTDVAQLKEKLAGRELPASEKSLRDYYATVKDRLFSKGAKATVDIISSPYARPGQPVGPSARRDAEILITQAAEKVRDGVPFPEAARSLGLVAQRTSAVRGHAGTARLQTDPIAAISSALPLGGIAPVNDLGDRYVIVKCVARTSLGHASFEQSRDRIRVLYLDQAYLGMVRRLAAAAVLKIDQAVYAKIQLG